MKRSKKQQQFFDEIMMNKIKAQSWIAGSVLAILTVSLVLVTGCNRTAEKEDSTRADADAEKQLYQCSMHPNIISEKPGTCPICAMDLQPVKQIKAKGIPGRSPVELTAQQQQLINIRVAPVVEEDASKTIRAVGIITYDATRVADVNARVMGWVEELYADKPGQFVRAGEPLMALYSPELYSAQKEYLLAWERVHLYHHSATNGQSAQLQRYLAANRDSAASLLESSRKRLELWEITPEQIRKLEETRQPKNTLELVSPLPGVVLEKNVFPKQMIQPGMKLYRIADLSRVWLEIEVYEYELPLMKEGHSVTVRMDAYPDETFEGKVDFIYPYLEIKTRTAKVRLVLENPDLRLRPDMYAHAENHVELGVRLLVPASAVFDTGKQQYVFVKQGEGIFVPKLVKLGPKSRDRFVVLEGVKEGEEVVVDGNFLLDSESQLKAAASGPAEAEADQAHEHFTDAVPLPAEAGELYAPLITDYLSLQTKLAQDSVEGVADTVNRMRAQTDLILSSTVQPPKKAEEYWESLETLKEQLQGFAAPEIETARTQFGTMSAAFISLVGHFPPPLEQPLVVANCPMWKRSPGNWIQTGDAIVNPFMGPKMLTCGEIIHKLEPPKRPVALPQAANQFFSPLMDEYMKAAALLTTDKTEGLAASVRSMSDQIQKLLESSVAPPERPEDFRQQLEMLKGELDQIDGSNLETARVGFGKTSEALIKLLNQYPPPLDVTPNVAECPMWKKSPAQWLQFGEGINNPFMGQKMLSCGEIIGKAGGGE